MGEPAGSYQEAQSAFSAAVATLLRDARVRQGLTQAQVAARTGGQISKAALANYETGHRSLRVDVFWLIAKALGEDAGSLLAGAERRSGYGGGRSDAAAALTVDIAQVQASTDPRLAPVQRWFALRMPSGPGRPAPRTVTLDSLAVGALADLMGVSPASCRALLLAVSGPVPGPGAVLRRRAPMSTPTPGSGLTPAPAPVSPAASPQTSAGAQPAVLRPATPLPLQRTGSHETAPARVG